MTGLIATLFLGLFILIGSLIVFVTKNNNKIMHLSLSIALGVMSSLIVLELFPETIELLSTNLNTMNTIIITIVSILVGIVTLKILDLFVPDHDHHHDCEENTHHLFHIGLVSSIALVLHNIIEGMAVFTAFESNASLGFLVSLGVGLHNIPLGMVLTSTFYSSNKSIKKTMFIVTGIALSTFVGGLIMLLLSGIITDMLLGILLGITLGMLIYIVVFELIPHIFELNDKKTTILGIVIGVVLFLISLLFD